MGSREPGSGSEQAPVEPGDTFFLQIEELGQEGDGVGYVEGFVIIVPGVGLGGTSASGDRRGSRNIRSGNPIGRPRTTVLTASSSLGAFFSLFEPESPSNGPCDPYDRDRFYIHRRP